MDGFPSAFHGFLTFRHEVCRSKKEEGEPTFLSTKRDGGRAWAWAEGEWTPQIKKRL